MITIRKYFFIKTIRISVLCIVGLLIYGLSSCTPQNNVNFELTTATTLKCTPEQINDWNLIQEYQMGVAGRDPVGDRIDHFPRREATVYSNKNYYFPFALRKKALCGTLFRYGLNDTGGDEVDWNNNIMPSEPFLWMLTAPLETGWAEPHEYWSCVPGAGDGNCIEAEITPDDQFENNPWFLNDGSDYSPLEGQEICTYGPYVGDGNHNNKPEIHPSELYWFRTPKDEFGRIYTTLMLLQEDSNRFDRSSDYDLTSPPSPTAGWRPWSAVPRTGEFSLAFEVTVSSAGAGQIPNYDISEAILPRNVVTKDHPDAYQDADDGKEHAITYNGQDALRVHELQSNDNDIGVQFKDVCRVDDNPDIAETRLHGYVTLTSVVGKDDRGEEGYHILYVYPYQGEQQAGPAMLEPAQVRLVRKILPETNHPSTVEGKTEILANLQVSLIGRPDVKESDLKIVKVERVEEDQRQELAFISTQREPGSSESQGIVKDVPVSNGAKVELTTESGKVFDLSTPPISLAPAVITERPLHTSRDSMIWESILVAVGGETLGSTPPPDQLQKVSQWELQVMPRYAPLKDGLPYAEDDSPVAEELNEIIDRIDAKQLERYFGSGRPFSVEWTYEAKNLTTGEKVSVNTTGNATSNEVEVQIRQDGLITESLNITFPEDPENALFELIITGTMTDTRGNTSKVQHTLWSHILLDQDKNKLVEYLIPTVAVLAGVSPDELVAAGRLDPYTEEHWRTPPDSKYVTAEMLRMIAIHASQDEMISVFELASLIRGAKLFGSK